MFTQHMFSAVETGDLLLLAHSGVTSCTLQLEGILKLTAEKVKYSNVSEARETAGSHFNDNILDGRHYHVF